MVYENNLSNSYSVIDLYILLVTPKKKSIWNNIFHIDSVQNYYYFSKCCSSFFLLINHLLRNLSDNPNYLSNYHESIKINVFFQKLTLNWDRQDFQKD